MRLAFILALSLLPLIYESVGAQELKSPSEFLGYNLGSEFTYHHKVVDYIQHVESNSEKVLLYQYGETYERRELYVAYISSPKNLSNLQKIQENNLCRAGLANGNFTDDDISIVWLSYNVHGNEANSTETSMKVLYELVKGKNPDYERWLEKTVIILDPCLNPDGRDRYSNWYNQVANASPNPNINSREHHEDWESGRSNHYLFDLNRDWVWQTQIESQQRLKLYNDWLPHVHVDFHEQGYNSQYFFAPAAKPMHEQVTQWQKKFQALVGKNNAKYFDERGWLYFTRESFDLLYPAYGDTYPTFNGGIGMTYEMPGHSLAGLTVETEKGDSLTLNERIDMHFTTSIATLEACYENRSELLKEFSKFFDSGQSSNEYYILKSDRKDRIDLLTQLLDKNKIAYGSASSTKQLKAYSYETNNTVNISLEAKDLIVPVNQPKAILAKVLFERNTKLTDTLTYDITAWSLPFMYGLDAYQFEGDLNLSEYVSDVSGETESIERPYAYLLNWTSIIDAKFLAALLKEGIKVSYSTKGFEYNGIKYSAGSLIIPAIDNTVEKYNQTLLSLAKANKRELIPLKSGASIPEIDLGSHKIHYLKRPKIALLAGDGISTLNFGELWYFFEREIDFPINVIKKDIFNNIPLDDYDVLILASGSYNSLQDENGFKKIDDWIKKGGNLVLIEKAIDGFLGEEKFSLEKNDNGKDKDKDPEPVLYPYEDSERENLKKFIQGGIIKITFDNSHPLAFGYDSYYYTLKNNGTSYKFLTGGWNVGYINASNEKIAGFIGSETEELLHKNVVFGVERRGGGNVIYMADNPVFRAFWQSGKLLLANAIFFNN